MRPATTTCTPSTSSAPVDACSRATSRSIACRAPTWCYGMRSSGLRPTIHLKRTHGCSIALPRRSIASRSRRAEASLTLSNGGVLPKQLGRDFVALREQLLLDFAIAQDEVAAG